MLKFWKIVKHVIYIMEIYMYSFDFYTYSREIIDIVSWFDNNFNVGLFADSFQEVFQTLHYNLDLGLPINTMLDDLDLVSRSDVCQNQKVQIEKKRISPLW